MRKVSLFLVVVSAAAIDGSGPTVAFTPELKMLSVAGGGSVPAIGPVIKVPYDRIQQQYLQIDRQPFQLRFGLHMDCADLKTADMTLKIVDEKVPVPTQGLPRLASGRGFAGTTTVTVNHATTAVLAKLVPDPVATCNADLKSLVGQNQHAKARMGWARHYSNVFTADLIAGCAGEWTKKRGFSMPPEYVTRTATAQLGVWVHCLPTTVPVPKTSSNTGSATGPERRGPRARVSGLQGAEVFVNPPANANYRGACPKELAFGGQVDYLKPPGDKPIDIRYRYTTHDGVQSPVFTTAVTQSGKKSLHYWKHTFGGGGAGRGFAARAAGGTTVINGWVRLHVLREDGTAFAEEQANFKLTCEPQRVSTPPTTPEPGSSGRGASGRGATSPTQVASLPDLVVLAAEPAPTAPTTLRIEVANNGSGASPATQLAVFYHRSGNVMKKSFDIPPLGPGESRWIIADVESPLEYAERLTARINDSGTVQESNLSNNTFTIR